MTIHKAGYSVILFLIFIITLIMVPLILFKVPNIVLYIASSALFILFLFVVRFFRSPNRKIEFTENMVIAPADGKIVAIEEITENEFIKGNCIQVSIFMSVWNIHINWYPVLGKIVRSLHFSGKYMAAWLPKSSSENERAITIIENPKAGKIVVKQIAGAVARRIITYANENAPITAGEQLGFIRFGSRVDVLIPVNSKIKVSLNDKAVGGITLLAELPD